MFNYKDMAANKRGHQNAIKTSNLRAINDRVLVTDMDFGDQVTKGGIIIKSDDGETRGIYPRWGKVFSKGPKNVDLYEVGQWILVEHGRWTRGINIDLENGTDEFTVRMVEAESVLGWSEEKPDDIRIGDEIDLSGDSARPEDFVNARGQMTQ
jgi:co-chaperonin GroES (HSP10)|tara:strand:+ start:10 stop:468 length:459 start_codon:yes stop_codon:yes gene_type:complete